ncbi:tannase/feruloyl esterase family alpha/beta hydrolase [Ramlibacter sp. G-1-2-2]|uniref:Tannase/feruloyl esterase family alpha/beta hydrolase n=1 Tax=Ramlibacter agri TaxID=2728837 RepID=A0A848GY70_9BURK|nr:tannase/feruloyl esterase family alpha/beta hydrolase [Ramlibacter agri]NML42351.1 tannase/feruloyl esterase family alpha/beta hydrolase [Ramlibacter agri]
MPVKRASWSQARCAVVLLGVAALAQGCGGGDDAAAPAADVTSANIPPAIACANLQGLQLAHGTVTAAQAVPAGSYQPPGSATAFAGLPAFCRVTATLSPVPGSSTSMELWLPATGWNGRYLQVGTNGFGGTIAWNTMAPQLQRGFATASGDSGHTSPGGFSSSWFFESPERFADFAGRSVHEVAAGARQVVQAYYAQAARYAYYSGTSTGGRDGLRAAQKYPTDFDGILAGAAIQHFTRGATQMLFTSQRLAQSGFQGAAGNALLNLVQRTAVAQCDAADGVVDGIIRDPRACTWDPHALVCAAGQDPATCLTPAQADAVAASTSPLRDPVTQQALFVGQTISSQADWISFIVNPAYSLAVYQMGLDDPAWNGSTFDMHRDLPLLEAALSSNNATNPDLSAFQAAGGKLIQYQSWEDGVALPQAALQYYDQVRDATTGGDRTVQRSFYRLFMIPGTSHGGTGPGPYDIGQIGQTPVSNDASHDAITALQAWVERGSAPQQFIATKFRNNDRAQGIAMQRPICLYPSQAVYKGSGDTNDAGNFSCQ